MSPGGIAQGGFQRSVLKTLLRGEPAGVAGVGGTFPAPACPWGKRASLLRGSRSGAAIKRDGARGFACGGACSASRRAAEVRPANDIKPRYRMPPQGSPATASGVAASDNVAFMSEATCARRPSYLPGGHQAFISMRPRRSVSDGVDGCAPGYHGRQA
jgi:hypothetical protein